MRNERYDESKNILTILLYYVKEETPCERDQGRVSRPEHSEHVSVCVCMRLYASVCTGFKSISVSSREHESESLNMDVCGRPASDL